jgi:hypothetical protein
MRMRLISIPSSRAVQLFVSDAGFQGADSVADEPKW